jgi:hypothetical protein
LPAAAGTVYNQYHVDDHYHYEHYIYIHHVLHNLHDRHNFHNKFNIDHISRPDDYYNDNAGLWLHYPGSRSNIMRRECGPGQRPEL